MNIFGKPKDYLNWAKLIQHCDVLEELTDIEKEKAKRAFQFLRQELGEKFLVSNSSHPFVRNIVNLALWTRKWIILFAEELKELKDQGNYPELLDRLKDTERYDEANLVLDIGYKFSRAGFDVTIDPSVDISGRVKVPDLKLVNRTTNEEIFAEVSIIGESLIAKNAFQTLNGIFDPLWRSVPFIQYCGRIHKTLSEKHLREFSDRIEKAVERAVKENAFQELIVEGVIELGLATENDKEFLEKWATTRNLTVGQFSGPSYNVDEISRTDSRFRNEQRQLPPNYPNILIVQNNNIFYSSQDIRGTISRLEEIAYKYSHLLAGIITGRHMGIAEMEIVMKDQHVFIKQTKADLLVEKHIILLNKFCKFKVSPSTITKIYESFRAY